MNKLGLIPIFSVIIVGVLSLGIFADSYGLLQNQDPAITLSNIDVKTEQGILGGILTIQADAFFNEDLKSIEMNGTIYKKDGTYTPVNLAGNPVNGLKDQSYKLEYSNILPLTIEDLENMAYLELTIKTINNNDVAKEMTIKITNNGQKISDTGDNQTGINFLSLLGLQNSTGESTNSNYDVKISSGSGNPSNSNSGSSSQMSASEAKQIAKNAIAEPGLSIGYYYYDNSVEAWIFDIENNNGELVDRMGVDSYGHTFRI